MQLPDPVNVSGTHTETRSETATVSCTQTRRSLETLVHTPSATKATLFPSRTLSSFVSPSATIVAPDTVTQLAKAMQSLGVAARSTGVIAVAVSAVAGPGAAVAANRQAITTRVAACGASDLLEELLCPDVLASPTQMAVGSATGEDCMDQHRGAIVGNVALVVGMCLCHAVAAHFEHLQLMRVTSWLCSVVFLVLLPPTMTSGVFVALHDGSSGGGWRVAGVAGIAFVVATACVALWLVYRSAPCYATDGNNRDSSCVVRWFALPGGWRLLHEGAEACTDAAARLRVQCGLWRLIEDTRDRWWAFGIELVFSLSVGGLGGI
jgi:hypothetical protein